MIESCVGHGPNHGFTPYFDQDGENNTIAWKKLLSVIDKTCFCTWISSSAPISSPVAFHGGMCFKKSQRSTSCRGAGIRCSLSVGQGTRLCRISLPSFGGSDWRICSLCPPVPAQPYKRTPINNYRAQATAT